MAASFRLLRAAGGSIKAPGGVVIAIPPMAAYRAPLLCLNLALNEFSGA